MLRGFFADGVKYFRRLYGAQRPLSLEVAPTAKSLIPVLQDIYIIVDPVTEKECPKNPNYM
jgi:hypothetical protein